MNLKQLLLLTTGLIFSTFFLQAQAPPSVEWQLCLPTAGDEQINCVRQTKDSGYILSVSQGGGGAAGHIFKLNKNRQIEWESNNLVQVKKYIEQTIDGGYISTSSPDIYYEDHDDGNSWLTKYNNAGVVEWETEFGGNSYDAARAVKQTLDGGYIVAGNTKSTVIGLSYTHGGYDFLVAKFNSNGTPVWQKSFGGSSDERAYSIELTSDSGYIIAGETKSSNGIVTGFHGLQDAWVIKLKKDGVLDWQKCFGGSANDGIYSICKTTDGGYILGGYSNSVDGDIINNNGSFDAWAIKIFSNGLIEWQKCIGGSNSDYFSSVEQTFDGGYVFVGATSSNELPNFHGQDDYFINKLSSSGNLEWQKCFGGSRAEYACSIDGTFDGGYIVGGASYSTDGDLGNIINPLGSPWLVKLNYNVLPVNLTNFTAQKQNKSILLQWQTQTEINTKHFIVEKSNNATDFKIINTITASGNSSTIKNYSCKDASPINGINYYRLKQVDKDGSFVYSKTVAVNFSGKGSVVYPNPASSFVTIVPSGSLKSIAIIDVAGKLIQQLKPTSNQQYNISHLPKGLYSLKLFYQDSEEVVQLQKQ